MNECGRPHGMARNGVLVGISAYTAWGFFPLYFKQLGEVSALDVLAWRIVLSAALLGVAMLLWHGPRRLARAVWPLRHWRLVLAATAAISINWLTFIVAIDEGEVLQSSLGYFLVPLVNSLLGMLVFGERANRWKVASISVAALGMLTSFLVAGVLPGYALVLASSFGLYGMLRKRMTLDSTTGLLLETLLLTPVALGWLLLGGAPLGSFAPDTRHWLMLSGAVTLLPLLLMVFAARRIELGTLGVLQYITPVMHFCIAIGLYGEALDPARLVAFGTTTAAVGLWLVGSAGTRVRDRETVEV